MPSRRQFLGAMPAAALVGLEPGRAGQVLEWLDARPDDARSADEIAKDEEFWAQIARAFTVDRSLTNLNNGGVSPAPRLTQEAMKRHLDFSNQAPVYTMLRILEPQRESVRQQLARQFGCDTEEIAITRNASESLQICQLGFDLSRGDVVLTSDQDYPRMITTFEQRARREGIVLETFSLPTACDDPDELVAAYQRAMDRHQPKLLLMCHMLSGTGAIMPVRDVVRRARRRGIPVIVDGAHAFAHIDFKHTDLDCDYYGTSLHKWLFAPHGTGMLYVRKGLIEGLWPMMAAPETQDADIRKFEQIGTHPAANTLAIAEAVTFHRTLQPARKQARLRYLREHWVKRLVDRHPDKVTLHTSRAPGMACGIALVEIVGVEPGPLCRWLFEEHRIIVAAIGRDESPGVRVSPSVYTTLEELDRFCRAMEHVIEHGLPA